MAEETKTIITRICFYILTALVLLRLFFGIPRSLWWLQFLSPAITGLATYLGIISFNIHQRPFFSKLRLVPLFVAFGLTAPLVELPDVLEQISKIFELGAGEFGLSGRIVACLTYSGQALWLLVPVQIMISLSGEKTIYLVIGLCTLFTGAVGVFSYLIMAALLGPILGYLLGS